MSPRRHLPALLVLALVAAGCGTNHHKAVTYTDDAGAQGRSLGAASDLKAPPAAAAPRDATAVARTFVRGYLAAIYGRAPASHIRGATDQLVYQIARQSGRVPPAQRRRTPRVTALTLTPAGQGRLSGQATVDDGNVAPYPLPFVLEHRAGGWIATSVAD